MSRHELLSPAGSMDALRAAVQNGADAVYFGAGDFNARRNAENFGETLSSAVSYCHVRGARAFITLNTMVREDEFPRLIKTVESIAEAGADGVIVQDLGVAKAVREIAPTIELHASTQMAVHNVGGVEFLISKGFDRVVLAREMSIAEIRECGKTGAALEVFVHGALCVSCSGQCLLSSMIGGRSGNRGLCAQPCRMTYQSNNSSGYLLSTRDLCGLESIAELADAGVYSFKLEGRLKRPEYVGLTTRVYRDALDALHDHRTFDVPAGTAELKQMFNRGGFTDGYFHTMNEKDLMYGERPNNLGVQVGRCERDGSITADSSIMKDDVLCLRRGDKDIPVRADSFQGNRASVKEARRGDVLVRLVSSAQMAAERKTAEDEPRRIPVDIKCELHENKPATLTMVCEADSVSVTGDTVQAARSGRTDRDRIISQLEKTGDTAYIVRSVDLISDPAVFMPVSAINAMRREACERIDTLRRGKPHSCNKYCSPVLTPDIKKTPVLIAQSSDPSVLKRALNAGVEEVAWRPRDLRPAALEEAASALPENFELVLPPVMTQHSMLTLNEWALNNKDRLLRTRISNIGQLNLDWPGPLWGDSALNIANNSAVARLIEWGFEGYTPSVELNCSQIAAMGGRRSLVVYGLLPLMELRHCPYRNTHSLPGSHNACSRCDSAKSGHCLNDMTLTDRTGASFPLRRTASEDSCVIEMLNSAQLMLLRKASSLPDCESMRLILEDTDPVETVIALYSQAILGRDVRGSDLFAQLESMNTTTGHYFRGVL